MQFPERHAKSVLDYVALVADEAVFELIPQGRYHEAIESALHIEMYYPVGTVIDKEHAFAVEYDQRRREQISRILLRLSEKTGLLIDDDLAKLNEVLGRQLEQGSQPSVR